MFGVLFRVPREVLVIGPRCLLWMFDVLSGPVACEFFESFGNLLDAGGSERGISCGLVVEFRVVLGDYFGVCCRFVGHFVCDTGFVFFRVIS